MFFATPGETLGGGKMQVISQALAYDPAHPTDAEYVENVMWEQSGVLFVTMNIPGGSNNDDDNWYGAPTKTGAQIQEVAAAHRRRSALAGRCVRQGAVRTATERWSSWSRPTCGISTARPPTHIANYELFIDRIAAQDEGVRQAGAADQRRFAQLSFGQSAQGGAAVRHRVGAAVDQCSDDAWKNHDSKGYDVANFHRLVVHGSTFPLEYLRMTVDPRANNVPSDTAFGPFSWERVIP